MGLGRTGVRRGLDVRDARPSSGGPTIDASVTTGKTSLNKRLFEKITQRNQFERPFCEAERPPGGR